MENYNPDLVWYICEIISLLAIAGFLGLSAYISRAQILEESKQAPPQK